MVEHVQYLDDVETNINYTGRKLLIPKGELFLLAVLLVQHIDQELKQKTDETIDLALHVVRHLAILGFVYGLDQLPDFSR